MTSGPPPDVDILIVKTSSLGDVVHNLPMVSDIRAQLPDARIDWLVEKAFADIPALHPAVRTVIPLEFRRWRRALGRRDTWRELREFRARLRETSYDLILDSQGLVKSAVVARLGSGPVYGPDRHSAREPLAAAFYHRGLPVRRDQHAVWRNRSLAAAALGYALPTSAPDYGILPPSPTETWPKPHCVALHASSRASKLWPRAHWVALSERLARQGSMVLLPSGSAAEYEAAQDIARAVGPFAQALPRMSVRDLAAVIGGARAVIGVDTGLVHLAAALARPTVGIFCDSDPAQTGVLAKSGAISLGGFGAVPSVDDVVGALRQLGAWEEP
ncbi:MAG TPA: lipopolysaccharide heptosyltransferase I [Acidiferrobacter sp.]|nr:lipopolysaccharide heptosyltransferase I [Acidiferrobacter sp.]